MPTSPTKPIPYQSSRQPTLHRRNVSQASTASTRSNSSALSTSSGPTPTMEHLMRVISQAPRGSKIAHDAGKALLVAERERYRRTGLPLSSPTSPLSPGSDSSQSFFDRPTTIGPAARIGQNMLAPEPTHPEESPFELDDLLDVMDEQDPPTSIMSPVPMARQNSIPLSLIPEEALPDVPMDIPARGTSLRAYGQDRMIGGNDAPSSPLPQSPVSAGVSPPLSQPRPLTPQRGPSLMFMPPLMGHIPSNQQAIAIYWRGNTDQEFSLMTRGTGLMQSDDVYPVRVAARHTQVIEVPNGWCGTVRRGSRDDTGPYTEATVQFDTNSPFTFFMVSYVKGNNGPVLMVSEPSGDMAGSRFRAFNVAPPDIVQADRTGRRCIFPTNVGSNAQRASVRNFYREFLSSPQFGAILPGEESAATQATRDKHIVMDFYA